MSLWITTTNLAQLRVRPSKVNIAMIGLYIVTIVASFLSVSHCNVYHNDDTGSHLDRTNQLAQASRSFPDANSYMINHFVEPSIMNNNGYDDPYQTNMTSDLLDLLGSYILDRQAMLSEKEGVNGNEPINFNSRDYAENDLVESMLNQRRAADDGMLAVQQDRGLAPNPITMNLEEMKNILTSLQHSSNNNELDANYQKDLSNDDLDQNGVSNIPEMIDHQPILSGHQYVQGGAGEGHQLLGPDGSFENFQVIKTDTALPSYCDPPNPCPIGYTSADGCIEDFDNTAGFSREYQASQDCACDSEHSLFDCPSESNNKIDTDGSSQRSEADGLTSNAQLTTLARSIQNRLEDVNLKDIENKLNSLYNSKMNNNYNNNDNPYLVGDKLPIVAKKAPKVYEHHF